MSGAGQSGHPDADAVESGVDPTQTFRLDGLAVQARIEFFSHGADAVVSDSTFKPARAGPPG